jgi:hypothetical protein
MDLRANAKVSEQSPAKQLGAFLAKYDDPVAGMARKALELLRKRLPGAFALVYDNYNALAIAFSSSEKASGAIFSIAVYPRWISVFFAQGARWPDPQHLLKGSGNKMRHIVLKTAKDIQTPAMEALISSALAIADDPIGPACGGRLLIKAVAAKQRPRRAPVHQR